MMQSVVMLGRCCEDPELRLTSGGVACCRWRLAVDRDYRSADGSRLCDFFPCIAWRGTAEHVAKWWRKGQRMLAEGHMEVRSYLAADGTKRIVTEFIVERSHFCGDAPQKSQGEAAAPPDDDLPFS